MKHSLLLSTAAISLSLTACKNPADATTDAKVSEAKEEVSNADGKVYAFTDDSTISFVGSKVTGSHDGGFKKFDGNFVIADGEPVDGEFSIDMNSTWSDNEKLTQHLKAADFFHVVEYPQTTFQATGFEKKSDEVYHLSGNLTLHGVTKNITFPTQVEVDGDVVKISSEFDINREDFEITYPGKKDDLIRNEVVIKLDLIAKPATSA